MKKIAYLSTSLAFGGAQTFKNLVKEGGCFVTIYHDLEPENGNVGCKIHESIVYKMLEIQNKLSIKATYNVVGKVCEYSPDIVKEIYIKGHELANHTFSHEIPALVSKKILEESISKCDDIIKRLTGVGVKGFRSPQSRWSQNLLKILEEKGYEWDAEADTGKQPYHIGHHLIRMPITMDDWGYQSRSFSEKEMYRQLKNKLNEGIQKRKYLAFGFHPWIYGLRPERLSVFKDFISLLTSLDKIFIVPFGEVARLFSAKVNNGHRK